jgi:tRNA (guanine37-N1)-methyltransferase|tara:strand:+ start:832 stop:1599 length:768 start_codon:yes stop_codon:yes gene_type:complete
MLKKEIINKIPKSYDIVGDILIFSDFPKELKKQEKEIGKYLIDNIKNINVVAKKSKYYSGKYRTPKLKILAGEKRKETIHKENGVKIKINPEKAYFSIRSSTERLRIAKLIKKPESVLVMFSGVSPFPLTIAKHSKAKEIYGIEINKHAHKYAEENIKLNKFSNIKVFKGNVKKVLPKINKKFDRIIMPLPKNSEEYFDLALRYLKPKGTIHMYVFEREENFKKIKEKYKKYNIKIIKAGSPSPGTYRISLDIQT